MHSSGLGRIGWHNYTVFFIRLLLWYAVHRHGTRFYAVLHFAIPAVQVCGEYSIVC
jgi:hypothetical protein